MAEAVAIGSVDESVLPLWREIARLRRHPDQVSSHRYIVWGDGEIIIRGTRQGLTVAQLTERSPHMRRQHYSKPWVWSVLHRPAIGWCVRYRQGNATKLAVLDTLPSVEEFDEFMGG